MKNTYLWNKQTAYSVGLIASDGCLLNDGRHIDLTSNDEKLLNTFSGTLGKKLKIGQKKNSNGGQSYRVQFSDVAYYDFLLNAGLTPRKSHTIHKINVPDEYYKDFLRGVFDGDGTVYGYFDTRWPNSFMYYTSITSASIYFLEFLRSQNKRLFNTSKGSVRKHTKASILAYAKKDSKILYEAMYTDCASNYLERKKAKFENFIALDNNVKIGGTRTSGEIGKHASLRG